MEDEFQMCNYKRGHIQKFLERGYMTVSWTKIEWFIYDFVENI